MLLMRNGMGSWAFVLMVACLVAGLIGCATSTVPAVVAVVPVPVPVPVPAPPTSPPSPMAGLDYWLPFADNAGGVVRDVTGNGHDGGISGTGNTAVWAGRVGLVVNDSVVTLPQASGRASMGMCAYFPAGGSPSFPEYRYGYLYGLATANGENGYDLRTSYGPGGGVFHGADAYWPSIGYSNGGAATQSAVGFTGNHCVEGVMGGTVDHLVVDGVEVGYLTQGSSGLGIGGLELMAPMYISGGNGTQFGTPVTVYSAWGTSSVDTVEVAADRTRSEVGRLQGLGVLFGLPVNTGTDSVCAFDGTSIDQGYKAGLPTSTLLGLDFPCTLKDFSENGQPELDMVAGVQDRAGKVYHPAAAKNIAYNGGVVNSVTAFLESPADALVDLLAWNAKLHGLGYKTIVSTMMSACVAGYNGLAGDALAQQFNALLLAQGESFDWVDNLAAWPQLGATGACNGATYFADGLHPTSMGQALYVQNERQGFEGVYGTASTTVTGAYTQMASDRKIVANGVTGFDVTLIPVNTASFNSAGRVCVQNAGTTQVRVVPRTGETIDGQVLVELQGGMGVCVRPVVLDATVGGARWTIY